MSNHTPPQPDTTSISRMTTPEFLSFLRLRQIEIRSIDERLKISAPAGTIDGFLEAELRGRKAALLEALSETENRTGPEAETSLELVPLTAEEQRGRIPLTPAQQGMWLIDHFNPGNVAYNVPEAFRFEQPIALEAMQTAVDQLIERHSILRTSFHEEEGELFQTISATAEARVRFTDLSSLPEEESERSCRELIRDDGRRAFELESAPLARFHLFRLGEGRQIVFLNIHHIISDRMSLYILREELVALSMAAQSGSDAQLPEVPLQFADYAAWVATQMRSEAIATQTANWMKKLAGLPAFVDLPHSRPVPEKRSAWGTTRQFFVPVEVRTALNKIGSEEGASPFMTFLAVFAVAVARWSQVKQSGLVDFCIGSPFTHRRHPATQRMIGLFVNMLAFRCTIVPGMSFREVLRQVRDTAFEAYENSDVPFQRLVREINPDRRSRRSPIFQVMFGYETYLPPVANEFQINAESGTVRYDLSLVLMEMAAGDGLSGVVEYSTDLFEAQDIERLAEEGYRVMQIVADDPDGEVLMAETAMAMPRTEVAATNANQSGRKEETGLIDSGRGGMVGRILRRIAGGGKSEGSIG